MPTQHETPSPVTQLRVIVEAADHAKALAFFRDALGLREQAAFEGEGEARVSILEVGRATLELANPAQRAMIDDIEVGGPSRPGIRLAFEVDDTRLRARELEAAGARMVGGPVQTPWRSLNARLEAPAGLQITLFQELMPLDEREQLEGFATAARRDQD